VAFILFLTQLPRCTSAYSVQNQQLFNEVPPKFCFYPLRALVVAASTEEKVGFWLSSAELSLNVAGFLKFPLRVALWR
jgi:hypothetical protein